jgi:hypothetical protein
MERRVRVWVLNDHRYGLLPVIRRIWGKRGVRVHAPYATKYKWGHLHEAMEVDGRNAAELLFTPAIELPPARRRPSAAARSPAASPPPYCPEAKATGD